MALAASGADVSAAASARTAVTMEMKAAVYARRWVECNYYNQAPFYMSSVGVLHFITCQDPEDRCRSHYITVDVQSKERLGQIDARFGLLRERLSCLVLLERRT